MEKNLNYDPHTALISVKVAFYKKMNNGMLEPSAREFKEGWIAMEGLSREECINLVNAWAIKNGIVLK